MIKVLQNWDEIGEALLTLQKKGLPLYQTPQKNWDHNIVYELLSQKDRSINILDLGCGEGYTLKFLNALGFQNLHGIDLQINLKLRLKQIYRMLRSKNCKKPFSLINGNFLKTPFKDKYFDYIYSISVIEHGVDIKLFLNEVHRILKPNGLFFLTTDYWREKIQTDKSLRLFGLPWTIFSQDEIELMIDTARNIGFDLFENSKIPPCSKKTVYWNSYEYTFIALLLKKI